MMGTREILLQWFSQRTAAERRAVVQLLSVLERKQLEAHLQSRSASEQARLDTAERAQFERARRQLYGAPVLFQQVLAGDEVQAPPRLLEAVRNEIDGLSRSTTTGNADSSVHGHPWYENDLEILKQLWLRFLKIFKFK